MKVLYDYLVVERLEAEEREVSSIFEERKVKKDNLIILGKYIRERDVYGSANVYFKAHILDAYRIKLPLWQYKTEL